MMFFKYILFTCAIVFVVFEFLAFVFLGIKGTMTYYILCSRKSDYKDSRDLCADKYNWFLPHKKIKEFPTITFEQFRDFYYLNEGSWKLYEYIVQKNNDPNMVMTFTYPEWIKYKKFYTQVQKAKEHEKENKKQQEIVKEQNRIARCVLESVQKDIDAIRAEQQKNINDTVELIKGVKL